MALSAEKQLVLSLSDEEIRKLLKLAQAHSQLQKARASQPVPKELDSYKKLQNMVGMEPLKEMLDNMVSFHHLRRIAANRGRLMENAAFHAVLKGPPGTGKTTAAQLMAQILHEVGICTQPTCTVCSRADLIGQFSGSTAPKVREVFQKALGGVLLIDEAYSLLENPNSYGGYGDEAIAAIIEEMERHRDDLVVLFAGYPKEMDQFLKSNPGISSRIQFSVDFQDYTLNQLVQIAHGMAGDKGFAIREDAEVQIRRSIEDAMLRKDFGNARYVRKLVEQSIMAKARKIRQLDTSKLSDEELFSLEAEDIADVRLALAEKKRSTAPLGFCA